MPSIKSMATSASESVIQDYVNTYGPVPIGPQSIGYANPNPATPYNRGTIPNEYMSDSSAKNAYPDTPYFIRSQINSNAFIRNLALQALATATKVQ